MASTTDHAEGARNDDERRVLDAIDDAQIVRDLRDLVAIASVDGTPGEADAQRWCADRLAGIGLRVDTWDVDLEELQRQRGYPGMEVERSELSGCVARLGPEDEPALALCGHTDVVPPGDLSAWSGRDPFALEVDDAGRAWGRGACDMKAGLVAVIAATAAVMAAGPTLSRSLAVHCVSAEEDGGAGAFATLLRGHRADACVIAEPTAGDLIPANAGSLTFRLEVEGLATHGSTRTRGVSAIEKFEVVHAALRALEAQRNVDAPAPFDHLDLAWPLSVGIVSAGDWASTVPDRLVAAGRYGVRVDESVDAARAAFEASVADACATDPWLRDHPVGVSWPGGVFAPGSLPPGHRLLDEVRDAVRDVRDETPRVYGGPYGSDLRHYASAGVPTLQYGPGDVRHAHAVDEHVLLDDVFACARVYALLAVRACSTSRS
ncbi:MAG TPA: ArgE/DapE family deacylase [Nocardioidaceae bacterium]|nr:ArgE/DapE family deacylase [Nocardioidaceae bacterium]